MNLSRRLYLSSLCSLAALMLSVSLTAAPSVVARAAINLEALTNQPFAVNLPDTTKIAGEYSLITGPEWLSLTSQGILFGTPTKENEGAHDVYASALRMGKEYLFHFVVTVRKEAVQGPKYEFEVKVGEILKADLAKITGIEGTYEFPSLPAWLKGLETGVLIGEPSAQDAGATVFMVNVQSGEKKIALLVKVVVTGSVVEPKPWMVKTGETFRLNLEKFLNTKGLFRVKGPTWMYLTATNELVGTPDANHIGMHRVDISVTDHVGTSYYWFNVQVVP